MYAVIATLKVNKDHAKEMAKKSCITITELADTLARDYSIPFRKAHSIASYISKQTVKEQKELCDWKVEDVNEVIQGYVPVPLSEEEWKKIISPEYFVQIRSLQGGPNPDEVSRMIKDRNETLTGDLLSYEGAVRGLKEKRENLINFKF